MQMLVDADKATNFDVPCAFKLLWITNALDGSEDYLVSDRIVSLVGEDIVRFWEDLLKKPPPKTIKEVLSAIIPLKGINRKTTEGFKLLESGEIEEDAEDTSDSDEIGDGNVDAEQLLEALQEIRIEFVAPEAPNDPNTITGDTVSL